MGSGSMGPRRRMVSRCVGMVAVLFAVLGPASGHAAQEGEAPQALYEAALAFLRGEGTARDPARALELLRQAADLGHPAAMRQIGNAYYAGAAGLERDPREAMRWWERAASRGDAVAAFNLGRALERGRGGKADPKRAAAFYRIAAEAGHPKARTNLGIMFYLGRGVDRDPREALRLFEQAAADGDAIAQYNAGLMRARGVGGARDLNRARRLLEAAAAQDYRDAQIALARLLRSTAADDEGRLAALYWYEVAAVRAGPDLPADARGELAELRQAVDPARAAAVRARARTFAPADEPPRVPPP